jgi:lipopolysaccharide/colanic/teichoic acid biosynthesis glycosyltransferase
VSDPRPCSALTWWAKAGMDVVLGSVLALVALPVIVVAALGSLLVFRASPFVVQERIGYRGRTFRFLKLRTLPPTVPPAIDKYALAGFPIPWWGRALRAAHIDELPQLLLVPVRRMSLVGPRPEMVALADRYPLDFAAQRTRVLPGCTGLWQVSVASTGMIYEAPEYDSCYIAHLSLSLDLWILVRTVVQFLGGPPLSRDRVFRSQGPCREPGRTAG